MYAATESHPLMAERAALQLGVLSRRQLRELGLTSHFVAAQLDARRWTAAGDSVILLQNAPPTRSQLIWMAVLGARPTAALCSHTALELAGFRGFASEAGEVHLIVDRGARPTQLPGVRIHESRRLREEDVVSWPPRTRPARYRRGCRGVAAVSELRLLDDGCG